MIVQGPGWADQRMRSAAPDDGQADLRLTAIHEAGHAVVAEALTGAPARVEIERHTDGRAVWHRGRCTHVVGATATERQLIALAGPIAETLATEHRSSYGDTLLRAVCQRMSVSDSTGAGSFSRGDVDRAIRVVLQLWPSIEARGRQEIALVQAHEQRRRGRASLHMNRAKE